jgi:hypothetical protein
MIFFRAFREFWADVQFLRGKPQYLSGAKSAGKHARRKAWFRLVMQALVTLVGLVGGFYLLLSKEASEDVKKLGSGLIGTVFGFWFRVT